MSYLEAIILGIVQGLTEFLPVSSSGHLVILEHFLFKDHSPDDPAMIFFGLILHVGTVVAILFYYRDSVRKYFGHLFKSMADISSPVKLYKTSVSVHVSVLAMVSIMITGVIYVLFHGTIEEGFNQAWIVAVCWLLTGGVLLLTDRKHSARRSLRDFGIMAALLVGFAQGVAMFPGVSRSGSTICVAVLLGLHRRWAGEYSFLIGVPTILGATFVKGIDFFSQEHGGLAWGPTLAGGVVSAVVGLAALALLIWAVRRAKLKFFAIYCFLAAAATLVAVALGMI